MTTYNLDKIQAVNFAEDLLNFQKSIALIDSGRYYDYGLGKSQIYIHELEIDDESIKLRKLTNNLKISLVAKWTTPKYLDFLEKTILPGENPKDTLSIRIYCTCPNTKWCSMPKELDVIEDLSEQNIEFLIDLEEVENKLIIEAVIVRIKNANPTNLPVAIKADSVVSSNKLINIYIDEPKKIGASFLPIEPEDTGNLLFDIRAFEDPTIGIPSLQYNSDFKKYFKSDQFNSIGLLLYNTLPFYVDMLAKRFFFNEIYDESDKEHVSFIDYLSDLTDIDSSELKETIRGDELQAKVNLYMIVSIKIFRKIQSFNGLSLKKMLKSTLKKEEDV